jgi:dynein light intermediate chain 1
LLTEKSIPESLTVILLDWAEPWNWLRQIRDWICFLYAVVDGLKGEASDAIDANVKNKSGKVNGTAATKESAEGEDGVGEDTGISAPGEWEDAFGLPLCFVCHNVSCHLNIVVACTNLHSRTRSMLSSVTTAGGKKNSTTCSSSYVPFS